MKPPQKPAMIASRVVEAMNRRPSGAVRVATKPMRNEPSTLTSIVPHGKVSPISRATTPEAQKRAMPPAALPTAIQR